MRKLRYLPCKYSNFSNGNTFEFTNFFLHAINTLKKSSIKCDFEKSDTKSNSCVLHCLVVGTNCWQKVFNKIIIRKQKMISYCSFEVGNSVSIFMWISFQYCSKCSVHYLIKEMSLYMLEIIEKRYIITILEFDQS